MMCPAILETFIKFRTFFRLFTAPVYDNEQTAIESYDGGEYKRISIIFFGNCDLFYAHENLPLKGHP